MSKKKQQSRSPTETSSMMTWMCSPDTYSQLTGYTKLSENPEVQAALQRVADLVSSMTIHLMENTKDGDKRIKNELSRKIDITPCKYITRKAWIEKIVNDMLVQGNSVHLPHYSSGFLEDIQPIPTGNVSIIDEPGGYGYYLLVKGVRFDHDDVLHFIFRPNPDRPWCGRGLNVQLKAVAKQLAQARHVTGAIMSSPTPSIIVKVDGLTEEFASKEGRKKLREQYLDSSESGEPWFIPAEAFSVEKVEPLNLNDLAIKDSITLDKQTAAAIVGVPAFIVGAGKFDADEFNNFIRMIVLPIAQAIQQELTRKLLISPNWYFRFNPRSLYAYSVTDIAEVTCNLTERAIIDRNEARDWIGYNPREGLSELSILENYIPYAKIGEQKKLKGGAEGGEAK
jgi:HK97 family phage portal protein